MTKFKVRRKGTTSPVYEAEAPDRIVEYTVSNGTFSALPGDYVIHTGPGRILIVPARFFDRAWEYADAPKAAPPVVAPVVAPPPPVEEPEDEDEEVPPLEDEPATAATSPDPDLWALTARELGEMAVGYQINTKRLRTKKQLIDAIKAAERG